MFLQLVKDIVHYFLLLWRRAYWRFLYPNTMLGFYLFNCSFKLQDITIKNYTYGEINILSSTSNISHLLIGHFCSLAKNVIFILSSEHPITFISTYPFKVKFLKNKCEATSKGNIIVQDDVWIGYGSTILSGLTIGQGAVIAAGSVVTKDVDPYSVVGGVPAKVIKYRFREEVRSFLLTLDYGRLTKELVEEHIKDLYKSIDEMSLDEVKKLYKWFPKKEQK